MEHGKDRIDPDHAEHARTENHNRDRHRALAEPARSGKRVVHERRERIAPAHDMKLFHARGNDLGVRRENAQEAAAEEHERQPQHCAHAERIHQTHAVSLLDALFVVRAIVLADESRACRIGRRHDLINQGIGICRSGVSFDDRGAERVDGRLDEQVCHRKNRVLQPGGNADGKNALRLFPAEDKVLELQPVVLLRAQQNAQHQHRRGVLRKDRRQRDAVGCHLADNHKKQVQADIEPARDGKEDQRALRVARGGQHGAAEIVKRHCRKPEGIDAHV